MTTSNLQLAEFGSVGVPSGSALTANMRKLDTIVQLTAIAFATAPPASPIAGDRYIVEAPATGDFLGRERHVATYESEGWTFVIPEGGWIATVGLSSPAPWIFNLSTQTWEHMTTTAGSLAYVNIGVPFYCPGAPTSSQILMQFVVPQAWTIPANLSGSKGHIGTNPTATWTGSVTKNGVAIGSMAIDTSGVFSFSTTTGQAVTMAAGDVVRVIAPAGVDATAADVSATLVLQQSVIIAALTKWEGGLFFPGHPSSSQLLVKFVVVNAITLPANLSGAVGAVGTNPTGAWSSNLSMNGAVVGTINCSTGGIFSFTTTGGVAISVPAGARFEWEAPSSADATIANISATLQGDVT